MCCLFLISYRTFIAFFSQSKAITIYINRFGEQFIDISAIIIIWIICVVGLIFLIRHFKKEEVSKQLYNESDIGPLIDENKILYDIKNGINVDIKKRDVVNSLTSSSHDIIEKLNEEFKKNKH